MWFKRLLLAAVFIRGATCAPDLAVKLPPSMNMTMAQACDVLAAANVTCTSVYDRSGFVANDLALEQGRARIVQVLGGDTVVGLDVLQDQQSGFLHPEESASRAPNASVALAYQPQTFQRSLQQVTVDLPTRPASVQTNAPYHLAFLNSRQRTLCKTRKVPCQFADDVFVFDDSGKGVRIYSVGGPLNGEHVEFQTRDGNASRVSRDSFIFPEFLQVYNQTCAKWQGTHIAALAVGAFYGVAKDAEVVQVVVKPGCRTLSTTRALADGLFWVKQHAAKNPGRAVVTIEAKVSVLQPDSVAVEIVEDLLTDLHNMGIPITTGAGTGSLDACSFTPGRLPFVITAAGAEVVRLPSKVISRPWDRTNYGECVTLYAQAVSMESAFAPANNDIAVYSGTAQAAGLTAGVVAALLQRNPQDSVQTLTERLVNLSSTAYLMYSLPDTVESVLQLPLA